MEERWPGATESEAAQALKYFTAAYNAADKAYDPALDGGPGDGVARAINQAAEGTGAGAATRPTEPLKLTDATYIIPKKAGWPRRSWRTPTPTGTRTAGKLDNRWLVVFVRSRGRRHLGFVAPSQIPEFTLDEDGLHRRGEPVLVQGELRYLGRRDDPEIGRLPQRVGPAPYEHHQPAVVELPAVLVPVGVGVRQEPARPARLLRDDVGGVRQLQRLVGLVAALGLYVCRAFSPAWLIAPSDPVTRSASSAGSYALSAAL
ncbi:hypothetical protein SMICM304S_09456 [Streptomyces microflavus]